ncbi:MAG: hypothetical protein H7Y33_17795 [Cytophagales bacterium]|nr:hypothetical protein [Rhizobacter sp.]
MILNSVFKRSAEISAGLKQGLLLGAAALVLTLPPAGLATLRPHASLLAFADSAAAWRPAADFASHPASDEARFVANWVIASQDNRRLPFVILDKREARVFVFAANGRLIDTSPVLLGAAVGDDSVAGIGERPMDHVQPQERTTPAGRFVSQPGKNASGEDVVWVDYAAAVSMHRVRLVDPKERRFERLASPDPAQRRISYGCINIPVAFFESVIWPVIGAARGVVYVLPETKAAREVFARTDAAGASLSRTNGPNL